MSSWTWYWIVWLVLGFVVPEGIALVNKSTGDTLSENVWAWLRGKQKPGATSPPEGTRRLHAVPDPKPITWNHNTWRTYVAGSFLIWLFCHLTFGWFSG